MGRGPFALGRNARAMHHKLLAELPERAPVFWAVMMDVRLAPENKFVEPICWVVSSARLVTAALAPRSWHRSWHRAEISVCAQF